MPIFTAYAIKMGMLMDNPCKRVTVPKGSKRDRKILTVEQTEQFLKLLEKAPLMWRAFFTLDVYSGMRRGELLGLEWKDIDLSTGIVHIQRTSNYTKQRGLYTDTPKTETSKRFVKVPAVVIKLLKTHKAEQDKERAKLGSQWVDTDRLFISWNGSAIGVNSPYNWLERFCKRNDFPFYGIHQFRHFYASLLIGSGVDPTTVSGILGHSQVSTSVNFPYGYINQSNLITTKIRLYEYVYSRILLASNDRVSVQNLKFSLAISIFKKIFF